MANIILPEVEILDSLNQEASFLIEQDGEINRHLIKDFTDTIVENVVTMSNITIELTMDNWADKKQLVNIDKVTADNTIIVSAAPSNHKEYCQSGVYCSAQDNGVLTFTCDTIPKISLFVNIVILH